MQIFYNQTYCVNVTLQRLGSTQGEADLVFHIAKDVLIMIR